jgi:hypothetical protein
MLVVAEPSSAPMMRWSNAKDVKKRLSEQKNLSAPDKKST